MGIVHFVHFSVAVQISLQLLYQINKIVQLFICTKNKQTNRKFQRTKMTGQDLVKSQQELNGYRLEKAIGKDVDNRIVFRGVNYRRQRMAVKVIPIYPETLDFVFNEAMFCCEINHPCIVAANEFMIREENRQLVLFMEYCDGNLGLDLRRIRDEDLPQCAKSILDALFHIHEVLNITHCDLRPESIQISPTTPKISFYSIQIPDEVPSQCYLPPEFAGKHTREGDMWALGLILVELFSKKRLNEIIPDLKGKRKPAHQLRRFTLTELLKDIKALKLRNLLKDLLKHNPQDRLNINDFYVRMLSLINSKELIIREPEDPAHPKGKTFQAVKVRLTPSQLLAQSLLEKKEKQSNQKVIEVELNRSIDRYHVQSEVFRLSTISDRTKLRNLNLSEMKILKIQQLYDVPNLEWLYLESNLIMKIQCVEYPRLKGLNLGNNKIFKIQNLEHLKCLEELYLQQNLIEKIQNLEFLTNLRELYLNDNKIKVIENLWDLQSLRTVALKNNAIDRFESSNAAAITKFKTKNIEYYLDN